MNKKKNRRILKKFARPPKGKQKLKLLISEAPNWNAMNLPPFQKNFYREHPDVMNRLRQDVERFRNKHEITVQGLALNPIESFDEVFMPDYVAREIRNQGYSRPTPIQSQTWPIAFSGYNLVGIAQTGSGKTLAYILPAIIHINNQPNIKPGDGPIAVILAPTRELAAQIQQVAIDFGSSTHIRTVCTVGGVDKRPQELELMKGCEILVATPGRLIDFLLTDVTNMRRCTYLVLDEADRMLDMGFELQIRGIISQIRPDKQILMWSATWPLEIRRLAEDFLTDYIQVNIGSLELSANHNIKQFVHVCQENEKSSKLQLLLRQIYQANNPGKILIFVSKKKRADMISKYINNFGVQCDSLHGDKAQVQRTRILDDFRSGRSNIIVATDVAARGLDVDGIMYVINLDFPKQIEDYVHRIGRCGRCDRMGISYAFFTLNDAKQAKELIAILNEANQPIDAKLQEIAYNPQKVEKIDKKQRRLNESSGFEASLPEKRRHDGSNANFPSSSNIRGADLGERDGRNVSFTEIGPSSSNVRERDGRNFISGSIVRDDNIGDINSRNTNFNDMDPGSSNLRGAFMGERDGRNLDFNEIGLIGANVRGPRLGELDGRNVGLKEFDTNSSSARGARLGERDGRNFGFNDVGPSSPIVRGPQLGERDDRRFDFDDIGPSGSNGRGTANYGEPDSKRRRMGFEQIERNSFFDRNDVGDFRNSRNVDNDMLRRLDDRGFQEDSKFGRIRDREDDIIDRDRLFDERPPQQQRLFDRMDEPRMGSGRSNDFDAPQRFASSKNFNRDEDLIALDRMRNSSGPNFDQRESEFNRLNNLQDGSFCRKERDYFDVLDRPIDSLSRNAMNNPSGEMFNLSTADRRNYEREFRGRDNSNSYRVGSDNFDNDLPNRPFDSLIDRYDRNIDGMTGNTAFNSNRFPNGPRDQNSPLRNFENSREDFRESFQSSRFDTSDMRNDFIDDRDPDRWNNSAPRDNYPQNRREFGNDPEMRQRNNFEHLNMGRDSNLSFAGNNNFDGDFQNRNQRDFGRRNVNDRFNRFN